jgi:phosphoinositide 3-/4-kinase-like protein
VAGIGDAWGTREELLHPRDKNGRFRSKWKMAAGVVDKISSMLASFRPRTFQSDQQAAQYAKNLGDKNRFSLGEIARLHADFNPAQEDLRDGIIDEPSTKKFVDMMDRHAIALPDDVIVSRVVGPEAFGLTPETMNAPDGGLEDFTGKKIADRGYSPTNLGTPLGGGSGQVTMSIAVPKGTKAILTGQGGNDRSMYLQRHQELRVTKVKPDGRGGFYVLAVAEGTGTDTPEPLGGHVGAGRPTDREANIRSTQEGQARNMRAKGDQPTDVPTPLGDGSVVGQDNNAAPAPAQTLPDGTQPRTEPVHAESIGGGPAAPAAPAPAPAGPQPAQAPAPAGPPVAGPPLEDADVAKLRQRREARARYKDIARATPVAQALAGLDELESKKADNKAKAAEIRRIMASPAMDEVPKEPVDIRHQLDLIANGFETDRPNIAKARMTRLARSQGLTQGDKAGKVVDFDDSTMSPVGDIPEDGKVEILRPAVTMDNGQGGPVLLERAQVTGALTPKAKKAAKAATPRAPRKAAEAAPPAPQATPSGGGAPPAPSAPAVKKAAAPAVKKAAAPAAKRVPAKKAGKPEPTFEERIQHDESADASNVEQMNRWSEAVGGETPKLPALHETMLHQTAEDLRERKITKQKAADQLREIARDRNTPADDYLRKVADVVEKGTPVKRAPRKAAVSTPDDEELKALFNGKKPTVADLKKYAADNGIEMGPGRKLRQDYVDKVLEAKRGGGTKTPEAPKAETPKTPKAETPKTPKAETPAPAKKAAKAAAPAAPRKLTPAEQQAEDAAVHALMEHAERKRPGAKKAILEGATPEERKAIEDSLARFEELDKAMKAGRPEPDTAVATESSIAEDAAVSAMADLMKRNGTEAAIRADMSPRDLKLVDEAVARHKARTARAQDMAEARKMAAEGKRERAAAANPPPAPGEITDKTTIADLRKIAAERGVDLRGARLKADIRKRIEDAKQPEAPKPEVPKPEVPKPEVPVKKAASAAAPPVKAVPAPAASTPPVTPSEDPAVRGVQLENDIKAAFRKHANRPKGWAKLADIRAELGDKYTREEVDAKLMEMNRSPNAFIVPESNQKTLTQADRAAEIVIGQQSKHLINIDDTTPTPLPEPARPPTPTPSPVKAAKAATPATPTPRATTKIPDAPRGDKPLTRARGTDFNEEWGKQDLEGHFPGHITDTQLRNTRSDLAEGRISPEVAVTRTEDQIKAHRAEIADLREQLRSPMPPLERKALREKTERLEAAVANQEKASEFLRHHFQHEPIINVEEFRDTLPDEAKKTLDEATPASLREEAKNAGLGDLKGSTKEEVLDDLVKKVATKQVAAKAAKKAAPPAPKVAPFSEPGKLDARTIGSGIEFADMDNEYLKDIQERLDGGTKGKPKLTPEQAADHLDRWLAGPTGPNSIAGTKPIQQNGDKKHDAALIEEMRALYDQNARFKELADRLRRTPAPGAAAKKAVPTTETKLRDRLVQDAVDDLDKAKNRSEGVAALSGFTRAELAALAKKTGLGVGSKDTKQALIDRIVDSRVQRRIDSAAVARAASPSPTEVPKYSTKPVIPNKWGTMGGEVNFHRDGELGRMLQAMGGDEMLEVDGDNLANVVGRLATQGVRGEKTQQQVIDEMGRIRAKVPAGSKAAAAIDYALSRLNTPEKTVALPDAAPAPLKKMVSRLSAIPAARIPKQGGDTTELDQIENLAAQFAEGKLSGLRLIQEIRRLHNNRHESNEGKFDIDEVITDGLRELEELAKGGGLRPRPPKVKGGQGSPAEDLASRGREVRDLVNSGQTPVDIQKLGGGSGYAQLLTYPDGTKIVSKQQHPDENAADVLGSVVGDALGLRTAGTHTAGEKIYQEFLSGKIGSEVWSSWREMPEKYTNSETGRLIGILDFITANGDRNTGNWLLDEDGSLKPIDHGFAFGIDGDAVAYASPFARRFYAPWSNDGVPHVKDSISDLDPAELARLEARLRALEPQFDGHHSWFTAMMGRFEVLKAAAEKGWQG